ncbi:MAG: hypothetical protein IT209_04640 [Armatimonadetes bacterium]|nr:hypothetical protein [Armatimonadota bacterium]
MKWMRSYCLMGLAGSVMTPLAVPVTYAQPDLGGAFCGVCRVQNLPRAARELKPPVGSQIPVIPAPVGREYPYNAPPRAANSGVQIASGETISVTLVVIAAFPDYFFGQSEDGYWGVRVNYPGHTFVQDERVAIRGTIGTSEEGELTIEATSGSALGIFPVAPVVLGNRGLAGSSSPVLPFGRYSHPAVQGGAGLGSPGVLVTTAGTVTSVSPDGGSMTISDGSAWLVDGLRDPEGNPGVRIFVDEGPLPPIGAYVTVTGVGSYYGSGGLIYPSIKSKSWWTKWHWTTKIPVHFVRVSDDDGGRPAGITPSQAANWVTRANEIFAQSNLTLLYDPASDFSDFKSTLLNNMSGSNDPDWAQSSGLANVVASLFHSGKLVVFVRQAAGGFSWWDLSFVAMPAYNTLHCGTLNTSLFAHEIGHYLGLWHTFPTDPFPDANAAGQYFTSHGSNPAIFDGDSLPDTLPDPGIRTLECGSTSSVTLGGVTFQLPRDNLMSYYKDADTLSPLQKKRMHWTLGWRLGNKMPSQRNAPFGSGIMEAEDMIFTTHVGCPFGVQWMTQWGESNWSNGRQIFGGCSSTGEISFVFTVAQSGYYNIAAYMSHAPDFGIVKFYLDGKSTSTVFDGYGELVAPSGRRQLGSKKIFLSAGGHAIKAKIIGKNEKSSNYFMGVDCFQIN